MLLGQGPSNRWLIIVQALQTSQGHWEAFSKVSETVNIQYTLIIIISSSLVPPAQVWHREGSHYCLSMPRNEEST